MASRLVVYLSGNTMNLPGQASCKACPLHTVGTFVVRGEGPVPCNILIIGEAPGEEEDQRGVPFVGAAGKYLDKLLGIAGIRREDVYLTNLVKHWPGPGNPTPRKSYLRACRPWLDEEIRRVDPDTIFLLGATAVHELLGKVPLDGVGRTTDLWMGRRTSIIYPMLHPAAALHNPGLAPTIEDQWRKLTKGAKPNVTVFPVQSSSNYDLRLYSPIAVDLETTSLDTHTAGIVCIAISYDTNRAVVDRGQTSLEAFVADNRNRAVIPTCVFHNAGFDVPILERHGIHIPIEWIWDTMLSGYVLGYQPLGLKSRALRELGIVMETFEEVAGKAKDATLVDPAKLDYYAGVDASVTRQLYFTDKKEIEDNGAGEILAIEHQLTPVLRGMENRGILVDRTALKALGEELDALLETVQSEISVYGNINLDSPKQVGQLLFKTLGLLPIKRTKSKIGWSTDDETLVRLQNTHPVIPLLREYRGLVKLKGTYITGLEEAIADDGRIHTTFRQTGARSGRVSSADPNLQNIPSRSAQGSRVKEAFIASPGFAFIGADYSQIELRVAAALSHDQSMINIFERGEDIHLDTSRIMYPEWDILGPEEQKRRRVVAKTFNFGLWYGLTDDGLMRYGAEAEPPVIITLTDARELRELVLSRHPQAVEWIEATKRFALEHGYTETLLHRRRYFPELKAKKAYIIEDALKGAVNHVIQGTAADICKAAMVAVDRAYPEMLILQVHDSLILEAPVWYAEEVKVGVSKIMVDVAEGYLGIPVMVEAKVGRSWTEL